MISILDNATEQANEHSINTKLDLHYSPVSGPHLWVLLSVSGRLPNQTIVDYCSLLLSVALISLFHRKIVLHVSLVANNLCYCIIEAALEFANLCVFS